MKTKIPYKLAAIAVLFFQPAQARERDFKNNVATVDRDVMALVRSQPHAASGNSNIKLGPDGVKALVELVQQNGVSDIELHFLTELIGSSVVPLRLRPVGDNDIAYRDMTGVLRLWGESGAAVRAAIQTEYRTLWSDGADGYQAMLAHHAIGDTQAEALKKFAVQEMLAPVWDESNVQNAYKPIRETISALMAHNKALDEDEQRAGRLMMHGWFVALDTRRGDALPDFLYAWLRPKD